MFPPFHGVMLQKTTVWPALFTVVVNRCDWRVFSITQSSWGFGENRFARGRAQDHRAVGTIALRIAANISIVPEGTVNAVRDRSKTSFEYESTSRIKRCSLHNLNLNSARQLSWFGPASGGNRFLAHNSPLAAATRLTQNNRSPAWRLYNASAKFSQKWDNR